MRWECVERSPLLSGPQLTRFRLAFFPGFAAILQVAKDHEEAALELSLYRRPCPVL